MPGRDAGRREHVAVVDVEHAGVDGHVRELAREPLGVAPVRGGAAAVEQAGGGEHERAVQIEATRAPRRRRRAAPRAARRQRPCAVADARDDDRVRRRQRLQPVRDDDVEAGLRRHAPGRRPAHRPRVPVRLAAEDLRRDPEVEGHDLADDERDHAVHGRNLSHLAFLPLAARAGAATLAAMQIEILLFDGFDELDVFGPFEGLRRRPTPARW